MGKITASDNVSLDVVIQYPAGDEGFRVGGCVSLLKDRKELNTRALDEALAAEAIRLVDTQTVDGDVTFLTDELVRGAERCVEVGSPRPGANEDETKGTRGRSERQRGRGVGGAA